MKKYLLFLIIFAAVFGLGFAAVYAQKGEVKSEPVATYEEPAPTQPKSTLGKILQQTTDVIKSATKAVIDTGRNLIGEPYARLEVSREDTRNFVYRPEVSVPSGSRLIFKWSSNLPTCFAVMDGNVNRNQTLGSSGEQLSSELISRHTFAVRCVDASKVDVVERTSDAITVTIESPAPTTTPIPTAPIPPSTPAGAPFREPARFRASQTIVYQGQPVTFSWDPITTGASYYRISSEGYTRETGTASYTFTGSVTQNWVIGMHDVNVSACNDSGCGPVSRVSINVYAASAPPTPPPTPLSRPTVRLEVETEAGRSDASEITVPPGTRVTFHWTSTGAEFCNPVIRGNLITDSRQRPNDSYTTEPLVSGGIFAANCTNSQGIGVTSNTIQISIQRPPPQPQITRFGVNGGNGDATAHFLLPFSLDWEANEATDSVRLTIVCPEGVSSDIGCGDKSYPGRTGRQSITFRSNSSQPARVQITMRADSAASRISNAGFTTRTITITVNPPNPLNAHMSFDQTSMSPSTIIRGGQNVILSWRASYATEARIELWGGQGRQLFSAPLPNIINGVSVFRGVDMNGRIEYPRDFTRDWPLGQNNVRVIFRNSNNVEISASQVVNVIDAQPPTNISLALESGTAIIDRPFALRWSARNAETGFIQVNYSDAERVDYEEQISSVSGTYENRTRAGNAQSGSLTYLQGATRAWRATTDPGIDQAYRVRYRACNNNNLSCDFSPWVNLRVVSPIFFSPPTIRVEADREELRFRSEPLVLRDTVSIQRPIGADVGIIWVAGGALRDDIRCIGRGRWASNSAWENRPAMSGSITINVTQSTFSDFFVIECRGLGGTVSRTIMFDRPPSAPVAQPAPAPTPTPTPGRASETVAGVSFVADGTLDSANFTQGARQNINLTTNFRAYISSSNPPNPFPQTFSVNYGLRLFRRQGQNEIPLQFSENRGFDYDGSRGTREFNLATVVPVGNLEAGDYVLRATFNIFLATDPSGNFVRIPAEASRTGITISFNRTFTVNPVGAVGEAQPPPAGVPTEGLPIPPAEEISASILGGVSFESRGTLDYRNFVEGQYQNINLTVTFLPYIFNTANPFPERLAVDYEVRLVRREEGRDTPLSFVQRAGFSYENIYGSRGRPPIVVTVPVLTLEPANYVLRTTFTVLDENGRLTRLIPGHTGGNFVMPVLENPFTVVSREAAGQAQPPPAVILITPPPPGEEIFVTGVPAERAFVDLKINGEDDPLPSAYGAGTTHTLSWSFGNVDPNSCRVNWLPSLAPTPQSTQATEIVTGSAPLNNLPPSAAHSYVLICSAQGQDVRDSVEIRIVAPYERVVEFGEGIPAAPPETTPGAAPSGPETSPVSNILGGITIGGAENCATRNQITLSWNYSPPEDSGRTQAAYQIQIADDRSFNAGSILVNEPRTGSDESFTINHDFRTGTTYYWRLSIRERLSNGTITQWSRWSNERGIRFGEVGTRLQPVTPSSFTCGS